MKEINVVLYGIGSIGTSIGRFLTSKKGVRIVGAIDSAESKVGQDLATVLGLSSHLDVEISKEAESVLSETEADICIHSTTSFLKDTYPQIVSAIECGLDLVSTCEELSYPYLTEPELSESIRTLAERNRVTVLGTGINPGFLMDTIVIALTNVCQKIDRIAVDRIMNAATRRLPFQKKIGAGLRREEFKQRIEEKHITGHIGLSQSVAMIADALKWEMDRIVVEDAKPVITEGLVQSDSLKIEAGEVLGLTQKAMGIRNSRNVITLNFQAYLGAEEEYDAITIEGVPDIRQKIQPCIHGDIGTVAVVVNAVPKVINAQPGLLTMKDLSLPSAALEDMRKYISS